jgi:hypothetical protein
MLQRRNGATALPRPPEQDLAALVGLSPSTVSRCPRNAYATQLQVYWRSGLDLQMVMALLCEKSWKPRATAPEYGEDNGSPPSASVKADNYPASAPT